MAKKKTDAGPGGGGDRHQHPSITLRPPAHIRDFIKQIADGEDRTVTAVLLRGLRLYCEKHGYQWPGPPG